MRNHLRQILTNYWGFSTFRPLQEEIILSVLDGNDTLALLPTGGGKSICYQVPAMVKEGLCLVISPLISLIKDQVDALKKKGIPAVAIISGMKKAEIDIALDNCIFGNIKFLYVTPERLATEIFRVRLAKMKVNLLAVDEAHCISHWGYDFRPSYLQIAEIRQIIPDVPVIALTATATEKVREDIREKLLFGISVNKPFTNQQGELFEGIKQKGKVFQKSFARENLAYMVFYEENKLSRMLNIMDKVSGPGIIYVRNRRKCKEIAESLVKNNIKAYFYHAGMPSEIRHRVQHEWISDKLRVIVATNAFGMGIDKSNVRFVIHYDVPDSIEAYFQEAGRAGRDEQKAYAVLLHDHADIERLKFQVDRQFPEVKEVKRVYIALSNFFQIPVGAGKGMSYSFEIDQFSETYMMDPFLVFNSIKVLELQGLLSFSESVDISSRIHFLYKHDDLYDFQVRSPKFDHLIKTILRSYEGLFNDYVDIREPVLAKRAGISQEELIKMVQQLDHLKVLSYVPATDLPQITFMEERLDERDLRIDRFALADRKERYLERVKAMISYVEENNQCRSILLLKYFGEVKEQRCGICDYCLRRNKLDVSELEFDNLVTEVKSLLMSNPLPLEELVQRITHTAEIHQSHNLKVIEWLLDNERIVYEEGNLKWVGE